MSRLLTQLVADDPAIILVGKNTIITKKIAQSLVKEKVFVDFVPIEAVSQNLQKLQSAYKIILLYEYNYTESLQTLSQLGVQILVVFPVITHISTQNLVNSQTFQSWAAFGEQQTQAIIDCNYYLPQANFIFAENIIVNTDYATLFDYLLLPEEKQLFIDPATQFSLLELDAFVGELLKFVFIPKKQLSITISGSEVESTGYIKLIKSLYDTYYKTDVAIVQETIIEFGKIIPFSTTLIRTQTNIHSVATQVVTRLPAPQPQPEKEPEVEKAADLPSPVYVAPSPVVQPTVQRVLTVQAPPQQPVQPVTSVQEIQPAPANSQQPPDSFDLNTELQNIFKTTRLEEKTQRVEKIVESTKKIAKTAKRRTKFFYIGLFCIGLAISIIIFSSVYLLSGFVYKKQVVSFVTKTAQAQTITPEMNRSLRISHSFVKAQTQVYSQLLELESISRNTALVELIDQFSQLPEILEEADQSSKNLVLNILSGGIGETAALTENLTLSASKAYENLSLIQATLEQLELAEYSAEQQKIVTQLEGKIKELRGGMEIQQQLQQVLPEMLGVSQKRTYALVLQNNQELRPTGGFIQAIALLNFDAGSLVSYQVYSIYDLDRKVAAQVAPPEEIKLHLGEQNWYFRDSNWNPDFALSSKQISWFLKQSVGVDVDGVVGVNVFSLADLVAATGPIDLPEYNEVLTDKNLEERMEFHSEVVLVDSPESVDYSVKVLTHILEKLTQLKEASVPTLLSSLQNSFVKKQVQMYANNESEQSILQTLDWSGTLLPPECPSRLSVVDCFVDSIAQVEANVGVNKANYYLKRTISHNTHILPGSAQHKRTILFENNAQSNGWPKGSYKAYIRFFVNSNVTVDSIAINGSALAENQISTTQENGFTVIGVRVDVPIKSQTTLELNYTTPLVDAADSIANGNTQAQSNFSYVFYNRKQSGTDSDPLNVNFSFDPRISPVLIAPSASISQNTINFAAKTTDDASLFGVKFE